MAPLADVVRRAARVPVERFRRGGRPAILWTARLTAAATASYVVGLVIFPNTEPLLAPLTALLVVQLTPVSLLASGIDRVFSVVAGVSVAVVVSEVVHLSWWSLALVIAIALLIGQVLRLGSNLIEVPISAMLVLGVGTVGADAAAWERIAETLVGAGVGVLTNLIFPPKVATVDAGAAIEHLGDDLADLLEQAAEDMTGPGDDDAHDGDVGDTRVGGTRAGDTGAGDTAAQAARWLDRARSLTHDMPAVGTALLRAEQGRRLNVRALGTRDAGPGLRQGLEALEHSAVAVRGLFRSFADASDAHWQDDEIGRTLRTVDALTLLDLAGALRAFGRLVRVEAEPAGNPAAEAAGRAELAQALDGLREARARLVDLLLADEDPSRTELSFTLMSVVKRVLTELDLEQRNRRRPPEQPLSRPVSLLRATRGTTDHAGDRLRKLRKGADG